MKHIDLIAELQLLKRVEEVSVPFYGISLCSAPPSEKVSRHPFRVCLLTELCTEGTLEDVFSHSEYIISEKVRAEVLMSVLRGLVHLKRKRIAWRDLKGQNILIKSMEKKDCGEGLLEICNICIYLNDWGTAVYTSKEDPRRMTLHGYESLLHGRRYLCRS